MMILNGERLPNLLMTIIRFTLPSNDHAIKKLLLIVWEVWPKTTPDGKLLHEMILVCDAYRKVSGYMYMYHSSAYGGQGWSGQSPQQMNQPVHHLDQPCN